MKYKILLLVLAVSIGATETRAQSGNKMQTESQTQPGGQPSGYSDSLKASTPEQRAKMQSDKMKEKLVLTDDQYKQVSDLNWVYAKKMDPILHSDEGRFKKYRQAKSLMDEKDKKLKGILTSDQYKQYGDLKKEMMDRMRDSRQ
jgi:Spy/CpxP family protein refolding chaperone